MTLYFLLHCATADDGNAKEGIDSNLKVNLSRQDSQSHFIIHAGKLSNCCMLLFSVNLSHTVEPLYCRLPWDSYVYVRVSLSMRCPLFRCSSVHLSAIYV